MTERRTVWFVALIFCSGLLLGGTLMNLAEHYWLHAHAANEYDISQHRVIASEMSKRLRLNPEQQVQTDAILQDTVGQYQNLEAKLSPQFDQVREQDRQRLRAILTPQQRTEFDKIVREVDAEYPLNERPAVLPAAPCGSGSAAVR